MNIRLQEGLPFVSVSLEFQGNQLDLHNCLLDTGSAGTIFSADQLLLVGLQYEPNDAVHRIRGIGGAEFVFTKQVERLLLDMLVVTNFEIEVGAMDYGFPIDGIVGLDFLLAVRAIVDLDQMQVRAPTTYPEDTRTT
ncbi:MAG: aspartyl protease family protein [Caldilineaceae bacterium]